MSFQISRCFLLWTLLINGGCNAPHSAPKVVPQITATPAQQANDRPADSMPKGLFDQDPKGMEAWLRVTENGRYRVARKDDFQIPEAAMKEHLGDPFFTNKFAYVGG